MACDNKLSMSLDGLCQVALVHTQNLEVRLCKASTFDTPVLSFELNCVLKFGTKPSCGARKRRAAAPEEGATEVSVSFSVTPEGDYKVSDGVVTNVEGAPKSTDSGANEMMVSALAASAFLLL